LKRRKILPTISTNRVRALINMCVSLKGVSGMNLTQNEKIRQVREDTIIIGVDIASEVHYARAFDWRGIELGRVFSFENSGEGFERFLRWINELKAKHGKTAVLTGAEPTGHY